MGVIYPDIMVYLLVQFYALYPVLSRVILSFSTKCLMSNYSAMPNTVHSFSLSIS